jgi:hypothetical protein
LWYEAPLILAVIFTFIIIIIRIGHSSKITREKIRAGANKKDDDIIDYDLRLRKLEERIANLETIVLEQEKYRKFSSL